MSTIQALPEALIGKIAAGEVVERPASVVKELVENALDAGAQRIELDLELGGRRSIRVVDDGVGMTAVDAQAAFERHATSKISEFDDLERVATLGFRGEALAAIAAVAKVELVTAISPGDGFRVCIEGGEVKTSGPAPLARGTDLSVRSLFFNVPARRKFLKQPQTEMRRALEVMQGYALSRPDVAFVVRHEGRELLHTERADDSESGRLERIAQLFGARFAAGLEALESRNGISGFVGDPGSSRGRRTFVMVNRRLLRDRAVLAVFYRMVRHEWKSDRYPSLFLFVDIDPYEVDVNVHPQKSEVRFRDPVWLSRIGSVLKGGLQRARGEEAAPLSLAQSPEPPQLAWMPSPPPSTGSLLGLDSPQPLRPAAGGISRLPEASYQPATGRPVPLSGARTSTPSLRVLGQYKGTLLLLEGHDGLYLIDQHVAHERILYERFRQSLAQQRPQSQSLVEPLLLELQPEQSEVLTQRSSELEACGFSLRTLSGSTIALAAMPAVLKAEEASRLLEELASHPLAGDGSSTVEELRALLLDDLAASMACRQAVKMHHPLSLQEMEDLVAELFAADNPWSCPHGRPIVLKMTDVDLEQRFGRR